MMEKMLSKLKKVLQKDGPTIILTNPEHLTETVIYVVGHYTKQKYGGVYISLNRPHQTVDELLSSHDISTDELFYIDCITASIHDVSQKSGDNVLYVEDPSCLQKKEIVLKALENQVKGKAGRAFVVLDALRTLMLYNDHKLARKCIEALIEKTSEFDVKLVVLTLKGHDTEFVEGLKDLFDSVVVQ